MSELTPYPLVRTLLIELLGLEAWDDELPVALLARMYQHVLRVPLTALAASVEFPNGSGFPPGAGADFDVMHELYPETLNVHSRHATELGRLYALVNPRSVSLRQQAGGHLGLSFLTLFRQADSQWVGTWPAILLHRLTWGGGADPEPLLAMLEVLLGVDPAVGKALMLQVRMGTA